MSIKNQKLMNEVHAVMRLEHYSIHTERSYSDWIKRFVKFHGMKSRNDLMGGEAKIEQFLTHLAVVGKVSPSTQNQAMNALVFLYKKVLKQPLDGRINAVRARKKQNIPVVLSKKEVVSVISLMKGTPNLVVKLLYGSGLRVMEALRMRVHDIDYDSKQITVRSGKGDKDRVTPFPVSLAPILENHLIGVKAIHKKDVSEGFGAVYLPYALARKYPNAAREWQWQYVFPSGTLSRDPQSGHTRRHHIDPSVINKAIKATTKRVGIQKRISSHTFRHYAEFRTMPSNHISPFRMNDLFMLNSA